MKRTNDQIKQAAAEAAQSLFGLDKIADKINQISSGVVVDTLRYNLDGVHSDLPTYRLRFKEADRQYTTRAMNRAECKNMLSVVLILLEQNIFCGVATGGPMRFDRDDMREGQLGSALVRAQFESECG